MNEKNSLLNSTLSRTDLKENSTSIPKIEEKENLKKIKEIHDFLEDKIINNPSVSLKENGMPIHIKKNNPSNFRNESRNSKEKLLKAIDLDDKQEIILKEIKTPVQMTRNIQEIQQKNVKKKNSHGMDDENNFLFYNSLSLIMLSMLAGGLVGVVFILYFTFKKDSPNEEFN